jgi:hypothetical protein
MPEYVKVCNTTQMTNFVKKYAKITNANQVLADLDPDGFHICAAHFLCNDFEIRGHWLVKLRDTMVNGDIWIDIQIPEFNKLPNAAEIEEEEGL